MSKKQEFSPEFELFVTNYYQNKIQSAKDRGIEFKLNLVSVRNLLRTQKCPYTGITLTVPRQGKGSLSSDITIDRIDNKKGYIKGNVQAISNVANNFKSIFENPQYPVTMATAEKMLKKMQSKIKKVKEEKSCVNSK